jgi:hypothetical protein
LNGQPDPLLKMMKTKHKKPEKEFRSSHSLIFEQCGFEYDPTFFRFRIGTCTGLWTVEGKAYIIIAVTNSVPGNGHFEDVLEWFENSCRRDRYSLRMAEFFNPRLKQHMIEKRGFHPYGKNDVQKDFC